MNGQTVVDAWIPSPGGSKVLVVGPGETNRYYEHLDWLGSARAESSIAGRTVYYDKAFAPYGEIYDAFGNTNVDLIDFTGDRQAIIPGLYDTPNREQMPNQGRWISPDHGVELSDWGSKDPKRVLSTSFCEPFRDAIELGLSSGRNAMAIWQDLVSESGFRGGYQTVKRFVRKLRGHQPLQPRAVIVTSPGEEAQVDYGTGPMVRDPQTGKYRRTRLFVMTLGCSRKAVRLLTFRSSSRIWAELHEKAFRRRR